MKTIKDNIKVAAFDIDGTLLAKGIREFSLNTRKIFPLLKQNGIVSVLATAREFATIGDFLKVLQPNYFVGANGSFIYDLETEKFIYKNTLLKEDVVKFYNAYKDKIVAFSVTDFDKVFKSPTMDLRSWFIRPFMTNYYDFDEKELSNDDLYMITINTPDAKILGKEMQKFIEDNNLSMEVSSTWSNGIFISPKNCMKSTALEVLCERLGFTLQENLIAFGDGANDVDMLQKAYIGVTTETTSNSVKKYADEIMLDAEYDGAYLKLKELGLI
ncbi:HAD family hydrolase [Mycoplasma sp. 1199]|uniref:YcsE-related riboflavin metabolism phosphatase n=1 Tax=Mycoplasma sp. 1199 TaxID=3108526 RepID=UPI002B1E0388|nr:HAD family hydrolase [Mycoplasma sp. 1199]MEA4206467.1 HAD family hydrolase [Mycoplasma sp. 1199]